MKLSSLFTFALAGFVAASPINQPRQTGTCTSPSVRKEWRSLTSTEKASVISAIQCLQAEPGELRFKTGYSAPGALTRFEDFIHEHQRQTPAIHWVGHFLAWHRLYLAHYESELQSKCNLTIGLPYWDQTLDHGAFMASPVFDATTGFGGDGTYDPAAAHVPGSAGGGCVTTGPFSSSSYSINLDVGSSPALLSPPRCLKRNLRTFGQENWLNAAHEADVLASPDWDTFHIALEGNMGLFTDFGIHNAGHFAIGGDMLDMFISPSDPIFFLHHANVDRLWAEWQAASPSTRTFATGGTLGPRLPVLAPIGVPAGSVTLDTDIHLGELRPGLVKVAQVGDIQGLGVSAAGRGNGILCYTYI